MSKTNINLANLRSERLPRLIVPKHRKDPSLLKEEGTSVTRRGFVGLAALAGLSASTPLILVKKLAQAAEPSFSCAVSETRVAFTFKGQERWVVDTRMFGGSPTLTSIRQPGRIIVQLANATFPGTFLPANFVCDLREGSFSWRMKISFTLGQFQAHLPFESWLMGQQPALSPIQFNTSVCHMGLSGYLRLAGAGSGRLTPDWRFQFSGSRLAHFQGQPVDVVSNVLWMTLAGETTSSLVTGERSKRTLLALDRGEHRWSFTPTFEADCSGHLVCPLNAFQTIHIESWEDPDGTRACALLAEGSEDDGPVWFHPRTPVGAHLEEPLAFRLSHPQYVQVYHPRVFNQAQALRARFSSDPISMKILGCLLEIGGESNGEMFELVQSDQEVNLRCEPSVLKMAVPLAGALTDPLELPPGTRLIWRHPSDQPPDLEAGNFSFNHLTADSRREEKTNRRKKEPAQPFLPPSLLLPGRKESNLILPKRGESEILTDFRAILQVKGPFTVSVVRPEDLLVLNFEFHGWSLQKPQGQDPKVIRTPGFRGKSLLLVHFPPQHIAEQAFLETENPKSPDNEKVEFPIKAQMAGWSRLVFEIPSHINEIPYTLEKLLNWAHFLPLVAPSAAPPPRKNDPGCDSKAGLPGNRMLLQPGGEQGGAAGSKNSLLPSSAPGGHWVEIQRSALLFTHARLILDRAHRVEFGNARFLPVQRKPHSGPILPVPKPGEKLTFPDPPSVQELRHLTALEVPFRLFLSPSHLGGWAHALKPVALNNRIELWHSRLGVRKELPKGQWEIDECDKYNRTLRAIWSPDFHDKVEKGPERFPCGEARNPFRMLPEAQHRHQLVHLMANPKKFQDGWEKRYANVDRFMLSSLGAWVKLRYAPGFIPPSPLTVEEWVQHTNMGRDQFVKIVEQGFLFPFGHKAALIQVVERKFEDTEKGIAAVLGYKELIVVREPEKDYPGPGQQDLHPSDGRDFPYRKLRITTPLTPNLDPKENGAVLTGNPPRKSKPCSIPQGYSSLAFWPQVGGQDFLWHVVAEDWAGQTSEFSLPLIFITSDVGHSPGTAMVPPIFKVGTEYKGDRAKVKLKGQQVAFAPMKSQGSKEPKVNEDTILETTTLTFAAYIPCLSKGPGFPNCSDQSLKWLRDAGHPLFFPIVKEAEVSIRAVKSLIGTGPASDRTQVRYNTLYSEKGFGKSNKGEVFLELLAPIELRYSQTDKVGGIGAPNMDIVGLSRSFGPIGGRETGSQSAGGKISSDAEEFAKGTFKPSGFFKDAKILGGLDLADLITGEDPTGIDKAPALLTERLRDKLVTRFEMTLRPRSLGFFRNEMDGQDASLRLKTVITVNLPDPKKGGQVARPEPEFQSTGELENFELDFVGQIILRFRKFRFEKQHGEKAKIAVALADGPGIKAVEFQGALAFLAKLEQLIPSQGLNDSPNIEVSPAGVKAGVAIAIPTVAVGIMTFSNIKFGAFIILPFTGGAVILRIAFSSRNDPFTGSVWGFGITGFFAVEIDTKNGFNLLEIQIEFGGMLALDIGVASGGVKLVAGIYFKLEKNKVAVEGYIKFSGWVQVLGLVSISLMVALGLKYYSDGNKIEGWATVALKVEILFFEVPVKWTVRKTIKGPKVPGLSAISGDDDEPLVRLASYDGQTHFTQHKQRALPVQNATLPVNSPTIKEMLTVDDWNQYAGAFAQDNV